MPMIPFAENFGPSTWTATNWIGAAIYAVLFFVLLWVIYRVAEPGADNTREQE